MGDHFMAAFGGMDSVSSVHEVWMSLFFLFDIFLKGRADIDDFPAGFFLIDEPCPECFQDIVIGIGIRFGMIGPEKGGCDEDDLCLDGFRFLFQEIDSFLVGFETFLVQRHVNSVVHAVAGDDDRWMVELQNIVEAVMQAGPGKGSSSMSRLRESGNGFARQTKIDNLRIGEPGCLA